jgi:hypothetical protein
MKHISDELHDHYMLLHMVLSILPDMKDNVFFFGIERSRGIFNTINNFNDAYWKDHIPKAAFFVA